jgi:hypothetical protein
MLRIEVSLPVDLTEAFRIVPHGACGPALDGETVLSVVVAKCGYCGAPFIRCKETHQFCKNENCRKYASRDSKKYEPETGG